jgi:hypothetical protein
MKKPLLLIVFVITFFGCVTKDAVISENASPNITEEHFQFVSCENVSGGWACRFDHVGLFEHMKNSSENITERQIIIGEEIRSKIKEKEQLCDVTKGKWYCPGFCLPNYDHNCYSPLSDAGKQCTDSKECIGSCVISEDLQASRDFVRSAYPSWNGGDINCSNCSGICSKYAFHACEWRLEVESGLIRDRSQVYCD